MTKTKLYLGLSIGFLVIAIINLFEGPPFSELNAWTKFMKIGWFIMTGAYFVQYQKFRKEDNEKISR